MIAADSSLIIKYFSKEEGWEEAERVIEQGIVTLELAVKETANALWKKVLRGEMSEEDAIKILMDLERGDIIKLEDQGAYLEEAFSIATRRRIPIYDSLFISLAKIKGLDLATCDVKQGETAVDEGVRVLIL